MPATISFEYFNPYSQDDAVAQSVQWLWYGKGNQERLMRFSAGRIDFSLVHNIKKRFVGPTQPSIRRITGMRLHEVESSQEPGRLAITIYSGTCTKYNLITVHYSDQFVYTIFISLYPNQRLRWSRGSVLAFSTQVRGFKPGRSRRIFRVKKSSARLPSEGK